MVILERKFANWAIAILLALLAGCASNSSYFESPAESISANDRNLFSKALREQGKGRYSAAGKLWEAFLKEHPNSFEAHNNFGMAYFMDDELGKAITQFEAAHKWAPFSERIRANLSRVYQIQVSVMRENREYYGAIRHLKQLSSISTSMEKEKVLFMIEEVDHELFESLKKLNTAEGFQEYVKKYPQGPNAREARRRLEEFQKSSNETSPAEMQGTLTGKGKGGSTLDETNMAKVAELEDITEEILAAGKAPLKDKSLPPMAEGGDALPLEKEEPESSHPETAVKTASTSGRGDSKKETETANPEDASTRKLLAELQAIAQESNAGQDDLTPETEAVAAAAAEMEPLDSKTILEMQALADESGSKPIDVTPETETVSEAPAPVAVAEEPAPSEGVAETETPALEMAAEELAAVQETNGMRPDVPPETVPAVEAPAPAAEEEEPLPETVIEKAANEMAEPPQAESEEARLPETASKTQSAAPMAAEVRRSSVPVKVIVKVRSYLKVRSKPSLDGQVVGRLKNNDIRVMVKEVEGWYKVEHIDGHTGWISQRFSRKINDGSEIINMTTDNFKVVSYL